MTHNSNTGSIPETINEITEYKKVAFTGFVKISQLRNNRTQIPKASGIYVILRDSLQPPTFLKKGTGGFFKGKDPNVPVTTLEAKFSPELRTIYIGQSTDLHKRIGQLLSFGAGKAVAHWGGRYIWQLADAEDLIVAWFLIGNNDPKEIETNFLSFYQQKFGQLPFANLTI